MTAAVHSTYEALTVVGWLVVLAIFVAAAVLIWRGAVIPGLALGALALVAAAVLLL